MYTNELETLISTFLKENDFFDNTRNRSLVMSGFLNCRDSIINFLNHTVNSQQGKELTEEQATAVQTLKGLATQLKTYGAWVYVEEGAKDVTSSG